MPAPAARLGDKVIQLAPHCHTPHGPQGPVPHPPKPYTIVTGCPTVLIEFMPAARVTDTSEPCMLPGCVPAGPGMVSQGSSTVLIGMLPAARVHDSTKHATCIAPVPAPDGMILPPGCPTVMIGG